jgi:pimeloyl-ACP methyl ester carboxylesterase
MTEPPLRHYLGEARIGFDWVRGRLSEEVLAARWPGDGRTVIVLPGLFTNDARTRMLRRVLKRAGYRTYGWGLGRNMPVRADLMARLDERIGALQAREGGKVSLVGWSLGGVIAREYAKHAPERVAQVVTLGAPFSGDPRANRAWRWYEAFSDHPVDAPPFPGNREEKPPVPTTAIWSARDGVIPPAAARGQAGERDADLEIHCGHFAMSCAPDALEAVLKALSQGR